MKIARAGEGSYEYYYDAHTFAFAATSAISINSPIPASIPYFIVGHLVVYWHVATNTMSCNVDSSSNAYYIYNTSVIKV